MRVSWVTLPPQEKNSHPARTKQRPLVTLDPGVWVTGGLSRKPGESKITLPCPDVTFNPAQGVWVTLVCIPHCSQKGQMWRRMSPKTKHDKFSAFATKDYCHNQLSFNNFLHYAIMTDRPKTNVNSLLWQKSSRQRKASTLESLVPDSLNRYEVVADLLITNSFTAMIFMISPASRELYCNKP